MLYYAFHKQWRRPMVGKEPAKKGDTFMGTCPDCEGLRYHWFHSWTGKMKWYICETCGGEGKVPFHLKHDPICRPTGFAGYDQWISEGLYV